MKTKGLVGGLPLERWIGRQLYAVLQQGRRPRSVKLLEVHRRTAAVTVAGQRFVIRHDDLSPWWAPNPDLKAEAERMGETIESEIPVLAPGGDASIVPQGVREYGFRDGLKAIANDDVDGVDELPAPPPAQKSAQRTEYVPLPTVTPKTPPAIAAKTPAPATHASTNGHATTNGTPKGTPAPMNAPSPTPNKRTGVRRTERADFFRVCEHVRLNLGAFTDSTIPAASKLINEAFPDLDVAESTVADALELTGARTRRATPLPKVKPGGELRVVVTAVVALYEKLGESPPPELLSLAKH